MKINTIRGSASFCLLSNLLAITIQAAILEEITVTAQKREESLQGVPVAVTTFTGEALERSGGVDPSVLGDVVPNLHVGFEGDRDGVLITIRGVSGTDVRNASDPTTAFHVDGSYVARLSGANAYFYDVDRIEVLRGPQGTLYGRNSTSGVVNVVTKKPSIESFETNVEAAIGNYDMLNIKGTINVPLNDDIAARIAFTKTDRDGFRDNGPGIKDGDDADEVGLRSHILWNLSDKTSLLFTAESYAREGVGQVLAAMSFDGNPNAALFSSDPADSNQLDTQSHRDNSDVNYRLQLDHSFSHFDLFYQAAFRDHEREYVDDNDGFGGVVNGVQANTSVVETTDAEMWTYEVRLTSSWKGPLQGILGFFILDEEINGDFDFQGVFDPSLNACPSNTCPWPNGFIRQSVRFNDRGLKNESVAAFLHSTYDITDDLRLTAGIRWTKDEKDKGGIAGDPINGSTFILTRDRVGLGPIELFSSPQISTPSWTKTTWKVGLDYQMNEDWMVYATIGTGYKSGGYNRGSNFNTLDGTLIEYNPEEIMAYEGGFKASLMDGRARVNLAAFYYDYTDMQQASIFVAPNGTATNVTNNAAGSTIWGFELESEMLIGNTGSANLSLGYLNAEFEEFTGVQDPLDGSINDVSGNELINAPDLTATLIFVPRTFEVFNGTLTPRVQFHYETEAWHSVLNRPWDRRDSYAKTDLSLYYEHNSNGWYAESFVTNLGDDDVENNKGCTDIISSGSAAPAPLQGCGTRFSTPRQYGIRIGFRM